MATPVIAFTVAGDPQTKGSAKAFVRGRTARGKPRVIVTNDNTKCAAWSDTVTKEARAAVAMSGLGWLPFADRAVVVALTFRCPRPKRTKLPAPRLDLDKLARAVLDAMTGCVYVDDSRVVQLVARKEWGEPGVTVTVQAAKEQG